MEDVLIIGAGIFGLTLARKLRNAGRSVLVAEARAVGAGASATPLGVLAPHAPDNWNPKKQAQFDALTSLPAYLAELERETGIDTGYRQCGRMIPLTTENQYSVWQARIADAAENWRGKASLGYIDHPDPAWISRQAAPHGAMLCGLSASIDSRAYLKALAASIDGSLRTGLVLSRFEGGAAVFDNGERIAAQRIVLATGSAAFEHLPPTRKGDPAGRGEKGQVAVFETTDSVDMHPILYHDGTYVVPRGGRTIAVGATSERYFDNGHTTDSLLDEKIEQATALCPALRGAKLIERWAATRPRSIDRSLRIGPHPSLSNVSVATGGFKTGLAMAHTLDLRALE